MGKVLESSHPFYYNTPFWVTKPLIKNLLYLKTGKNKFNARHLIYYNPQFQFFVKEFFSVNPNNPFLISDFALINEKVELPIKETQIPESIESTVFRKRRFVKEKEQGLTKVKNPWIHKNATIKELSPHRLFNIKTKNKDIIQKRFSKNKVNINPLKQESVKNKSVPTHFFAKKNNPFLREFAEEKKPYSFYSVLVEDKNFPVKNLKKNALSSVKEKAKKQNSSPKPYKTMEGEILGEIKTLGKSVENLKETVNNIKEENIKTKELLKEKSLKGGSIKEPPVFSTFF